MKLKVLMRFSWLGVVLAFCVVQTRGQDKCNNQCHPNAQCKWRWFYSKYHYNCECNDGYEGNGRQCIIKDGCNNVCHPNAQCKIRWFDSKYHYYCECNDDYEGNGRQCIIKDGCNNACHQNAQCKRRWLHSKHDYNCECNDGYEGNGRQCIIKADGCNNQCHPNAQCKYRWLHSRHHYYCKCNDGYEGNGRQCIIKDCDSLRCHLDAHCRYDRDTKKNKCQCNQGFVGSGFTCTKEMDLICMNCHSSADCIYDIYTQKYKCQCRPGYEDPKGAGSCQLKEVNCSELRCGNNAKCIPSSYPSSEDRCECLEGYEGDGFYCHSSRSCLEDPSVCHSQASCQPDTQSNYSCKCNDGFTGDGYTCQGCFLYRLDSDTPSPLFHLKKNQDTSVVFNHIADRASQTKVLNDQGECLIGLTHKSVGSMNCLVQFPTEGEQTTIFFHHHEESLSVSKKIDNKIKLNNNLETLNFYSNDRIYIGFNCISNCDWIPMNLNEYGYYFRRGLKENHDTYVTVLFPNRNSYLVLYKNGACYLSLSYQANRTLVCMEHFSIVGDQATLIIRKHNDSVTLQKMEKVFNIIGNSDTLRIKSNDTLNVAFDCPGDCYHFEHAVIRQKATENNTFDIKLQGEIYNVSTAFGSKFLAKRQFSEFGKYLNFSELLENSTVTKATLPFEFQALLTCNHLCTLNISMTLKPSQGKSSMTNLQETHFESDEGTSLYLDFKKTRGIRWFFCRNSEGDVENEDHTAAASFVDNLGKKLFWQAACGVLIFLLIALCFYVIYLKNQPKRHALQDNKREDQETSHYQNSVIRDPTTIEEPIYEIISMEDLQEQHQTSHHNQFSSNYDPTVGSDIKHIKKFEEKCEVTDIADDAQSFKSNVSINSIYGEI